MNCRDLVVLFVTQEQIFGTLGCVGRMLEKCLQFFEEFSSGNLKGFGPGSRTVSSLISGKRVVKTEELRDSWKNARFVSANCCYAPTK